MTEIVYDENKLTKQSKIETNNQQQNETSSAVNNTYNGKYKLIR
jgi:hypothetical protein